MKRFIVWLLLFSMLILPLTSCKNEEKSAGKYGDYYVSTGKFDRSLSLLLENLQNYYVIRPDDAGDELVSAVLSAVAEIKEVFGTDLKQRISTDFHMDGVSQYSIKDFEIIIGNCDRDESREFLATIKYADYGYGLIGNKLVIAGYTEESTLNALNAFMEHIVQKKDKKVFFSNKNAYVVQFYYAAENLMLNGSSIADYTIVYPKNITILSELNVANLLRSEIAEQTGALLPISTDRDFGGGKAIAIGNVSIISETMQAKKATAMSSLDADFKYYMDTDDSIVWLTAENKQSMEIAAEDLIAKIHNANGSDGVDLVVSENTLINCSTQNGITIMTFNVLYDTSDSERMENVMTTIEKYEPDIFCLQEATPTWMNQLKSRFGSTYDNVGNGRDGANSGEYNPIFYLKGRFSLKKSGTYWLSDTPSFKSKYSGSSCNRIMTYAILNDNDGTEFAVVNTHLDHAPDLDTTADKTAIKVKQATKLIDLINQLCGDIPILLTGDFNSERGLKSIDIIKNAGFVNTLGEAISSTDLPTAHGQSGTGKEFIDYIFVKDNYFLVHSYQVCADQYNGHYPSDHKPIVVVCRLRAEN